MMACTSPGAHLEVEPLEDLPGADLYVQVPDAEHASLPVPQPTAPSRLTDKQVLRFDRELHRQLLEHRLAEAVDDHVHRVLLRDPAAAAIEELVVGDLRGRRLVLDDRGRVADLHVREGVRAALVAHQQRVALRVIARAVGRRQDLHQPAIGVLAVAGGDALRDDRAAACCGRCGSSSCRCRPAGSGSRAPPSRTRRPSSSPRQHAARVFPGDRRAGLDLRPADARVVAAAFAALGDEVVDAATALLVARIPVLHRRVLDLSRRSSATSSTTAACSWFSSRIGAVQPSR